MKRFLSVKILSVNGSFLGHHDQLPDSLGSQILCLGHQLFHRNTPVFSPELGNDTISTAFIAAFCDLQIIIMSPGGDHPFAFCLGEPVNALEVQIFFPFKHFIQSLGQFIPAAGSQNCVNLRDLFCDLLLVPLCQTACDQQGFQFSSLFILGHFQDTVDAFLFCIMDKSAGIDNDHICFLFLICDLIAFLHQHSQHFF